MTETDARDILSRQCRQSSDGTVKAWAKAHGFHPSYVGDVLSQRRPPSDRLLSALGLKRIIVRDK